MNYETLVTYFLPNHGNGLFPDQPCPESIMNYDTVLPDRILRRYRRRRLCAPHWIKRSLAIGAFTLTGMALICSLALVVPGKPDPRLREITQKALARVGVRPPQVSASIGRAPRATLVKLPDDNWNNVCTP